MVSGKIYSKTRNFAYKTRCEGAIEAPHISIVAQICHFVKLNRVELIA